MTGERVRGINKHSTRIIHENFCCNRQLHTISSRVRAAGVIGFPIRCSRSEEGVLRNRRSDCLSVSEFLTVLKTTVERREPGGQVVGRPFLCFFLFGVKRKKALSGAQPRVLNIDEETHWNGKVFPSHSGKAGCLLDYVNHRYRIDNNSKNRSSG